MSLRRSILIWMATLLSAVGLVAAAASYAYVKQEVVRASDAQLRQVAHYVGAGDPAPSAKEPDGDALTPEEEFLIQVWDAQGRVLRASDPSVALPPPSATGFADRQAGSEPWRSFGLVGADRSVQISLPLRERDELAAGAAFQAALPIAVLIPLSWFVLGFIIDRLMARLDRIAALVASRDIDHPMPVAVVDAPREVRPLVAAMNDLVARLQRAVEQQKRFVSDAAHELRTPLTALRLQIENARSVAADARLEERLDDAATGARRASALVERLLELARAESSAAPGSGGVFTDAPADLRDVLFECIADLAAFSDDRGVALSVSRQDAAPVDVPAETARSVVGNLVDNALRYTPSGGSVDVALANEGGRVEVVVRDTGPGIPPDLVPRIFERFFRAAPRQADGTGLGLAIAKSLSDRHGWSLTVENRQDRPGLVVRWSGPVAAVSTS